MGFLAAVLPAEAASVAVGVAVLEVTPEGPVHLINESEAIESEGVTQKLFAKAIAFGADRSAGGPAVLLSFDGIGIPEAVAEEVAGRLEKRFAIARERVAVCATHTHWAPHLKGLLGTIFGGPLPSEHQEHVDAYAEVGGPQDGGLRSGGFDGLFVRIAQIR